MTSAHDLVLCHCLLLVKEMAGQRFLQCFHHLKGGHGQTTTSEVLEESNSSISF